MRTLSALALCLVAWPAYGIEYEKLAVQPNSWVELPTAEESTWVPVQPLTLEVRSYKKQDEFGAWTVPVGVLWSGAAGSQLVCDSTRNGPTAPLITRYIITVGGTAPAPEPDNPTPEPEPIETEWNGIGPAVARAFHPLPQEVRATMEMAFRELGELATKEAAPFSELNRKLTEVAKMTKDKGHDIQAAWNDCYLVRFNKLSEAGRFRELRDVGSCWLEISSWLDKGVPD